MTDKELIKRRASYKGRLTTFSKYVNDLEDSLNPSQVCELQLRLGKIEHLFVQFDEVQLKLECLVDDVNSQLPERNEFESLYYKMFSKAQELLARNLKTIKDDSLESNNGSSRLRNHRLVKLPTIQLSKFCGSYEKWLEFRDTFCSLIHSNDEIDDVNKFHYLRASLEGSAAVVIQSIHFSASNYSVAWNILCERFDNKRLLIQNHVTSLFNLEAIKKESSVAIKRLIDSVNKNLRSLESLGEPTSHWDTLLIHIVTNKLDSKTYREWEEFKGDVDKDKSITLDMILGFLRNRSDLLETIEMSQNNSNNNSSNSSNKHKSMVSVSSTSAGRPNSDSNSPKSCPKCRGEHNLSNCSQFLGLSNEQRLELLPQYKICFNCFRTGHYSNHCKSSGCKVCKRKHNTLVHVTDVKAKSTIKPSPTSGDSNGSGEATAPLSNNNVTLSAQVTTNVQNKGEVLLATSLLKVYDGDNREHLGRAILDSGSTSCLITEKFCNLLNLPTMKVSESLMGINNSKSPIGKMCCIAIQSLNESFSKNICCFVLPSITDEVPCRQLNLNELNIPSDLCLADPHFYVPSPVDLIIGADVFWDLLGTEKINLGIGKPVLYETRLGWIASGPVLHSGQVPCSLPLLCHLTNINSPKTIISGDRSSTDDIQNLLMRFWQLEEVSHQSSVYSQEEKMCEDHFIQNTTRLKDGRFCVRIPLKQSHLNLGDSVNRAKHCLLSLERRFKGQPSFKESYCDFMKEYVELKHMSKCLPDSQKVAYFIPHHGVVRESSLTTKLRVVFNASSPTTSGVSFNQLHMIGPTVQDDLVSILLRFRKYKYVLSADVEKMYRQVIVHPDDRHLQQILWRDDPSKPMEAYQLNTVTYGTASAPYLATRCLRQVGLDCTDKKIAGIIKHDFYVDDLLSGGDSINEVIDIRRKVTAELASAGMPLRKWKSNNAQVVSDHTDHSSLNLNIGSIEPCKTLGLSWHTEPDVLCYSINPNITTVMTKRGVLSAISQIFDPLGLLAPYIIVMKIIMQKLWVHKLGWDDQLPSDISIIWSNIIRDLPLLNTLSIPRIILCDSYKDIDLHIFSDASQIAYGACLYVRSTSHDSNVLVRLLTAKSRVAPIKPTTIPRLELCAVLVGVRLYEKVIYALRAQVRSITFWTDSTIVLGWLKMLPNKLQPFVRNRVAEILDKTAACSWRHVPTNLNPADHISRGVDVSLLQSLDLWWSGPEFLRYEISKWPSTPTVPKEKLPEIRAEVSLLATTVYSRPVIEFNRFSSFNMLKRSVAYVLRFVSSFTKKGSPKNLFLSTDELKQSLYFIIRLSQKESFPEYTLLLNKMELPKRSPLNKFKVFLDEHKLLRVGGRLENSQFCYDKKHPFLIQSTHIVTKLLFEFMHKNLMHAGPQLLLASIRENYWPIGGRRLAKLICNKCILCCRLKGQVVSPLMGNLPQQRLTPGGYPFETVGVDYAGPIMSATRQGRGCRLTKVYIVLFVCFTTKAVHIELAGDLTSNNFLSVLRRFVSRRGKPKHIYSDNGTSFVGAYHELGKFIKGNCNSLSNDLANEEINFHFIPPYAPHFGGLWEAGIKSTKYHLKRVLGNCNLTFEELNTVLVQIEALLNSRPLTPLSSDANDLSPLTPGHFLIGRPLTALPAPNLEDRCVTYLTRYQRIEQLRQHFWSRWSKEYVSELQQRVKWRNCTKALEKDTLVLIKDEKLPPLKWRLGRVTAVFPGQDGISRVADIKTTCGVVRRAFSKICPLPLSHKEDSG